MVRTGVWGDSENRGVRKMIYITGDCHGDFRRFSRDNFPEQREMNREDFVIVCGDFGI